MSRRSIAFDHPPDSPLPESYEGFVQCVARGVPAGRAYRETFGARSPSGITPESAKSNAWRILNGASGPVLHQRIEHIRAELAMSGLKIPDRPDAEIVWELMAEITSVLSRCHELAVAALAPPELLGRVRKILAVHVGRLGRIVWGTSEVLPEPASISSCDWNLPLLAQCACQPGEAS